MALHPAAGCQLAVAECQLAGRSAPLVVEQEHHRRRRRHRPSLHKRVRSQNTQTEAVGVEECPAAYIFYISNSSENGKTKPFSKVGLPACLFYAWYVLHRCVPFTRALQAAKALGNLCLIGVL